MTQYFRAIPPEIEEAALLDRASRLKVFWRIVLPLSIPAQATLGIYTFLHAWNDYFWPLVSATRPEMYTLTVGLASMQTNFAQTEGIGFLMAQAVFAGLPVLMLYLFFQRHIVSAVAGGAADRSATRGTRNQGARHVETHESWPACYRSRRRDPRRSARRPRGGTAENRDHLRPLLRRLRRRLRHVAGRRAMRAANAG